MTIELVAGGLLCASRLGKIFANIVIPSQVRHRLLC